MTFRSYLLLMGLTTVICWGAVVAVLYAVDPMSNDISSVPLFYGSLFLALTGTFALFGIVVRKFLFHEEPRFVQVAIAFRQAIFFALLIGFILALSHAQLLRWWLIPILIAFFTVIEYLLLSIANHRHAPATA
ncbi:hypothetical protein HY625_00580 [Candidatus Uhrbacteria bacterium]|nr:hypothetical protein [Candidatus Uhrbacteria bacterium]